MSRRVKYWISPAMAEWVRRRRAEGATWREIGERLGFPPGNVAERVRAAMERAGRVDEARTSREEARREAEADPCLSRRCAKCGRPNYRLVRNGSKTGAARSYTARAVGFTRLGGRWLCPLCAPGRRREPRPGAWELAEAPECYGPAR